MVILKKLANLLILALFLTTPCFATSYRCPGQFTAKDMSTTLFNSQTQLTAMIGSSTPLYSIASVVPANTLRKTLVTQNNEMVCVYGTQDNEQGVVLTNRVNLGFCQAMPGVAERKTFQWYDNLSTPTLITTISTCVGQSSICRVVCNQTAGTPPSTVMTNTKQTSTSITNPIIQNLGNLPNTN